MIIDTEAQAKIENLRAALKKAKRGRSFAPDDERNEIVLIFEAADFEPVRAFIEEQP